MQPDIEDTVVPPVRQLAHELPDVDGDTISRSEATATPDAAPVPTVRPGQQAYRFVVSASDPIGLDRPAYIGRRPSQPRILLGPRPRLVRVPSATGEVSSTHLELMMQGDSVVATDLKSTNGTRVRIPGSEAMRLRQGESVVLTPGSTIDIGDGNVIEILPPMRPGATARIVGNAPS